MSSLPRKVAMISQYLAYSHDTEVDEFRLNLLNDVAAAAAKFERITEAIVEQVSNTG